MLTKSVLLLFLLSATFPTISMNAPDEDEEYTLSSDSDQSGDEYTTDDEDEKENITNALTFAVVHLFASK